MYKKYKIKRRKTINIYAIFGILALSLLFVSYGYAKWSDTLKITGKANILQPEEEGPPPMDIEISEAFVSINLPIVDQKVISTKMEDGDLYSVIEVPKSNNQELMGIYSFYYTNKTGYQCSDGTVTVNVTGSADALGFSSTTVTAGIANGAPGVFHSYISINGSKMQTESVVDFLISYNVNGEEQAFHYYVTIIPY